MAIFPNQVNPPLGYGHDLSCVDDVTSDLAEVDGRIALGQALARRIQTPRGGLIDDPDYGDDITGEIDNDLTTLELSRIYSRADAEFAKDERVVSSETTGSFISGALTMTCSIRDSAGPFRLTLLATSVTVSVVSVGS